MSSSLLPGQSKDMRIEEVVKRALWEPAHEWESRLKFVEDNLARHGLEKAIQLSIVWGNMKFLGCRYPSKTEALVSYYPLPTSDDLREIRKRRPSKRPLIESPDELLDTKKLTPSRQEVSNLISSIRSQTDPFVKLDLVESIGSKLCLCDRCVGRHDNQTSAAQKVLEQHTALCSQSVEVNFRETAEGQVCVLTYRGDVVIEKVAGTKKDASSAVYSELMRRVSDWQEANQFPPCKFSAQPTHTAPPPSHYPPPHSTPPHPRYPPPSHVTPPSSYYSPSSHSAPPRPYRPPPTHPQYTAPPQSGSYNAPPNAYNQGKYPPPQNYHHTPSRGNTYNPPPSSHRPPDSYNSPSDNSQQGRGNYYMPPRPQGTGNHGYSGGYNQDNYYRR